MTDRTGSGPVPRPHINSGATVLAVDWEDGRATAFRCTGCAAEWVPAHPSSEEAAERRASTLEWMTRHLCRPGVDPGDVLSLREFADSLAAGVRATLNPDDRWERTVNLAAQELVMHAGGDADLVRTARRDVDLEDGTLADLILFYAGFHLEPRGTDEERARRLAAMFACPATRPDPFCFRPVHARMALDFIDEALEQARTREIPPELAHVADRLRPVPRHEAVAALEHFEREACSLI